MIMRNLYYSLAALLFIAAGCTNNDFTDNGANSPVGQKRTITSINATIENADTRTQLIGGRQPVWQKDDHIAVFSDNGDWNSYMLFDGAGTASATFIGDEIEGSNFFALSTDDIRNYNADAKTITFRWPFDGFHKNNSNIWRVIPMFASGSNGSLQFMQLGGMLHFQVVGKGKLKFFALRPLDENYTDDSQADAFPDLYELSYGESVTVAPSKTSTDGRNEIAEWMNDENGEYPDLSETEPYDVYFNLPAGYKFEYGFMTILGVDDENGEFYNVHKMSKEEITINRATVRHYPAITAEKTVEP